MDSVNAKLVEDQSSRRKRKITIIISLIILFTLIICSIISVLTILKHNAESKSLSNANPIEAIRAVCSLTRSPRRCFTSIRSLQSNQNYLRINPSQIFALSLRASLDKLNILYSETQILISRVNTSSGVLSSSKECESLISNSLMLINVSMTKIEVIPDGKIFKETKGLGDLKEWISNVCGNLDRCKNGLEDDYETRKIGNFYLPRLKMKILEARNYVKNSLLILENMDNIMNMFYPPVRSMLPDFLLSGGGFNFGIVFYGLQYVLLIFLFSLLLRLY